MVKNSSYLVIKPNGCGTANKRILENSDKHKHTQKMRLVYLHLLAVLLIAGQAITWAQVTGKDFLTAAQDDERDKRAVDFGQFVRNLLLKSATASNVKANISRNLANVKATAAASRKRITTTTTTTTTPVPFFFNKGPFKFPFDLSGPINNKFNNNKGAGFINFDYNDYGGQPPVRPGRRRRPTTTTTTTTTTTSTTRAPATPARRRPIPRRPYGLLGKQKVPYYDYYDDYDYNYDDADGNNTPASTAAPAPAPPAPRPQRPPTANRAKAQGRVPQLRNRLIYQFRQPDDTSINNAADAPTVDNNNNNNNNDNVEASPAANDNSNNDETSANTNDYTDDVYDDDDVNAGPDNNSPTNTAQDYNDSSDNANTNDNPNSNNDNGNANTAAAAPAPLPPPNNFNFNNGFPAFQGQFPNAGANFNGPSGFGNFGPPGGFPYNAYNDFNLQYQPSSQVGYSVQHY